MRKLIGLLTLCLATVGCNTPVFHPWQVQGDRHGVTLEVDRWPIVSQSLYVAVPEEAVPEASVLLKESSHVPLTAVQEQVFNRHLKRPNDPDLKPYLIRAVTMGVPYVTAVRRNLRTNEVFVYRATWNGEIWVPYAKPKYGVWPIVIYLKRPPLRVYPVSVYGGDWVFARVNPEDADTRLINRQRTTPVTP